MKILQINKFWYRHGGADVHAIDLAERLKGRGHEVGYFGMLDDRNVAIDEKWTKYFVAPRHINKQALHEKGNLLEKMRDAVRVVYARDTAVQLKKLLHVWKPDVAHIHNIYHHLSPSVLTALCSAGVPVVQTLHDYKRLCPNHAMYTQGDVCTRCKGGKFYNAVKFKCVLDSRAASVIAATEMYTQAAMGWYDTYIDQFIAPSNFLKNELKAWGKRTDNVSVIHNWIDVPKDRVKGGAHVVYIGSVMEYKGIGVILACAGAMPEVHFDIVGEGSDRVRFEREAHMRGLANVTFHGRCTPEQMRVILNQAACGIVPSKIHDNYPLSLLEINALGIPVVGSDRGGIPEMIEGGVTGISVKGFETHDWVHALRTVMKESTSMGEAARARVLRINNPEKCIAQIEQVYTRMLH